MKNNQTSLDPIRLAEKVAESMFQEDKASQHMNMNIEKVAPGYALLSMKIQDFMLNGHGICHGGYLYTLADSAFAFASNSYNIMAVAYSCDIIYLQATKLHTLCRAEAKEQCLLSRTGIYDIKIQGYSKEGAEAIDLAFFRGKARFLKHKKVVESLETAFPLKE